MAELAQQRVSRSDVDDGGPSGDGRGLSGQVQAPAAHGGGRGKSDVCCGESIKCRRWATWVLEMMVWRCRERLLAVLGCCLKLLTTFHAMFANCLFGLSSGGLNEAAWALKFLETRGVVRTSSCQKVGYSILGMNSGSTTLHRLHFVISDDKPPNGSEFSEAVLRRLLANRAVGGRTITSGSSSVFQPSRGAPPQDTARSLLETYQRMLQKSAEVMEDVVD